MKTNSKRKFLCVLLAMVLVVAMVPATAFGATTVNQIEINKIGEPEAYMTGTYSSSVASDMTAACFNVTSNEKYKMSTNLVPCMYLINTDDERIYLNTNDSFNVEGEYWLQFVIEAKSGYSFDPQNMPTIELNNGNYSDNEAVAKYVIWNGDALQVWVLVKTVGATTAPEYNVIDEIDIAVNPDFVAGLETGTFDESAALPFVLGEGSKDAEGNIYEFAYSGDYYLWDEDGNRIYNDSEVDLDNTYIVETVVEISDQDSAYRFANSLAAKSGDENFIINIAAASSDEELQYNFYATVAYILEPVIPVVESFKVEFDWDKVPALEAGMTYDEFFDNDFEECPATVTGAETDNYYGWAIKIDESFYIDDEEAIEIYEILGNDDGYEFILDYNAMIEAGLEEYYGWLPLDGIIAAGEITGYEINDKDTYAVWIGVLAGEGKSFGEPNAAGAYAGLIDSNVEVGASIFNNSDDELIVFFELGTLAEMEDEKNGSSYPVDGVVPSLGDDSIKVEGNVVKFDVPADDEEYFYVKVVMPQSNLEGTGLSLEDYCAMINNGKGKDIVDVKALGDTLEELAPYSASGQVYGLSAPDVNFSNDYPISEKSIAYVVKLHRDNVKNVLGQYIYAVYGAHAEIVTPAGSVEPKPPVDTEEGALDVDTNVSEEAPIQEVTLGNDKKELLKGDIFTADEKEAIANGEDSKVWLEVDKVDEDALEEGAKAKFEEAAKEAVGNASNIVFF
ncbi:MAG: hypothetical protein IKU53_01620, partial [Firmicutes bacterium]|nr:hypothetical protein [Bacillota bacterium]